MEIKETRYFQISEKIIKIEDVAKIANCLYLEFQASKDTGQQTSISFSVDTYDDASFESSDPDFFATNSILSTKRIKKIEMDYFNYTTSDYFHLIVSQMKYSDSYFKIKGQNSKWVNGLAKQTEELINSFAPQNNFIKKHKVFFNILLGLGLGVIYMQLISLIPYTPTENSKSEWVIQLGILFESFPIIEFIFKYLFGLGVGIFPATFITDKLVDLWPDIEIQIGPEHTFIEKKRREWLIKAFVLGVLPLVISIVADFIKKKAF